MSYQCTNTLIVIISSFSFQICDKKRVIINLQGIYGIRIFCTKSTVRIKQQIISSYITVLFRNSKNP